jgi:hypothetical protein
MFLVGLTTPSLGITVSVSGAGVDTVSTSTTYNLDKSTSLLESVRFADGEISRDLTASGSGDNSISTTSSAKNKRAVAEIESSGNFQTSASTGASGEGVWISQDTAMSGSCGGVTFHADSPENKMVVSSGFEGEGDLTAGISAAAGKNAAISGNLNALGVEMLDRESLQTLSSGDVAMSVDGLYYMTDGGLGSFGLSAANTGKETVSSDTSALLAGPVSKAAGGNANAYSLTGYRWNTRDPQLKFVLKNDAYLTSEGLNTRAVKNAITAAANTWDGASNQNLFADSNLVTLDPTVQADSYNKINTVCWKPSGSSNYLGYTRTWYNSKTVDGYNTALDSDIVFNTNTKWTTCGNGIDVQSVALHEMGHTLGLGDIYGQAQFSKDARQVMHYYTGVKRTLGNGDATGIWRLYH